jgi:hypothetical protein
MFSIIGGISAYRICHHTLKTTYRDTSEWNATDWMYAGAGNADLTNWARAILVIDVTRVPGAFIFRATKRGSRIGWADDDGHPVFERLFCHQIGGVIFWRDATDDDAGRVVLAKAKKPLKTTNDFMALVPSHVSVSRFQSFFNSRLHLYK